ncbi:MAG: translation elongation factor EF-1 subunit alpha [archaeon]|jgi:elongation factor 1-alpha
MASTKPKINVIFIGHIDHGKSTTVGRVMYDTKNLSDQDYRKLQAIAEEKGKGTFAFAYLMDVTKEERDRGITIDVNYKKLDTEKYSFTVIDAPGHQDYVKNMITGTAQSDAAVLVIAAKDGIMSQTKEHAFLAQVMGIKQIIIAVNKMDEVNYTEEGFNKVKTDIQALLKGKFKDDQIQIVPISAWNGENIIKASDKMPWYKGVNLVAAMNNFTAPEVLTGKPLRLPIQDVYSIKGVGMVPVGRVETGILRPNDKVIIMPEGIATQIKTVEAHHEQLPEAGPGDNIGFNIRNVEKGAIKRGSVVGPENDPPTVAESFLAQIIVLNHPTAITAGYTPVFHIHTAQMSCSITELVRKVAPTVEENPKFLKTGDAAIVRIKPTQPLVCETFKDFPQLGRFAIRDMGKTVAAGVITEIKKRVK